MKKHSAIAALAAVALLAPFAPARGAATQGQCQFYCHVKDGAYGLYSTEIDYGTLEVYKIVRDAEGNPIGLGKQVPSEGMPQSELGSTGFNYVLAVTTTSDATSDTYAVVGEQLALVVKDGSTEVWRSYTALPPCAWMDTSVAGFEASGIPSALYSDEDEDGLSDYYVMMLSVDDITLTGGASGDYDNDGLTNFQEFMYGTDPTGGYMEADYPVNTITLKDWSMSDDGKATVKINGSDYHAYSIRYTTDLEKTGKIIDFATTSGGSANTKFIYHDDEGEFTQQVYFTLPEMEETYYVGIAVDGVLAAYTKIEAAAPPTPPEESKPAGSKHINEDEPEAFACASIAIAPQADGSDNSTVAMTFHIELKDDVDFEEWVKESERLGKFKMATATDLADLADIDDNAKRDLPNATVEAYDADAHTVTLSCKVEGESPTRFFRAFVLE